MKRLLAIAASLALLAASIADYGRDQARRRKGEAFARQYSIALRAPELYAQAQYEGAADYGWALYVRQALEDATASVSLEGVPDDVRQAWIAVRENADRELADARELCLEGLGLRPACGDHYFGIGATTFVAWQRRGDPRMTQLRRKWFEPLRVAAELEPGADDVASFRAEAELESWRGGGSYARTIFRRAFENPAVFAEIFPIYTAAVGGWKHSRPDVPGGLAQQRAALDFVAGEGDVDAYFDQAARVDRVASEEAKRLAETMEKARESRRDEAAGEAAAELIASIPLGTASSPGFVRALECWPEGRLESWERSRRRQVVDFFLDGRENDLTPGAIERTLSTMTGFPPFVAARLDLLAGDLVSAERIERDSQATGGYDWWPYRLEKARILLRSGSAVDAGAVLAGLDPSLAQTFDTRLLEAEIENREGKRIDPPAGKGEYAAQEWGIPSGASVPPGRTATLFVERPDGKLEAEVALSSETPAAIALGWDGDVSLRARAQGSVTVTLPVPPRRGRTRLELTTLLGGPVTPGGVTLRAAGEAP